LLNKNGVRDAARVASPRTKIRAIFAASISII
jgi:hypothetical protein